MNEFRKLLWIGLLGVGGCASNQDVGSGTSTALKGLAVDGYLAGAQVYVDTNNNSKLDDWEPHAYTDKDGYFSYNPVTNVNYCAAGLSHIEAAHCLKTTSSDSTALLRFVGGYDLTTSQTFVGTLTASVSVSASTSGNGTVINPVTTLLSYMTSAQRATFVANETAAAGSTLDLASDYTALTGTATTAQRWVAKLSMEIHKVTDVIEAGLSKNSISDARTKAYQALAAANYGVQDLGTYLTANMSTVVTSAANGGALVNPSATEITNRALEVLQLAENLFVTNTTTPVIDSVGLKGRMRAIEVMTAGLRDYTNTVTFPHATRAAATTNGDAASYITTLGTDASFVFSLIKGKFFPAVTYTSVAASLAGIAPVAVSSLAPGGNLAGAKLAVGGGTNAASLAFGANNTLTLDLNVTGGSNSSLGGANTISGSYQTLPDGTLVMNLEPLPGVIVPALVNVTSDPANPGGYLYSIDFNNTTTTFPIPSGQTGFCSSTTSTTTAGTC